MEQNRLARNVKYIKIYYMTKWHPFKSVMEKTNHLISGVRMIDRP